MPKADGLIESALIRFIKLSPLLAPRADVQYARSQIGIHAIWPQRAHLSPRVRYILDGLVACAAQGRFN